MRLLKVTSKSGWADRTVLIAACPALMAVISFWSAHVALILAITICSLTCSSHMAAIRFYMSAMVSFHVGSNITPDTNCHMLVTRHGACIYNWIYWTLVTTNVYKGITNLHTL
jgi:hypothetical protein